MEIDFLNFILTICLWKMDFFQTMFLSWQVLSCCIQDLILYYIFICMASYYNVSSIVIWSQGLLTQEFKHGSAFYFQAICMPPTPFITEVASICWVFFVLLFWSLISLGIIPMRVTSIEYGTFTENDFCCCICPCYFSGFPTFSMSIMKYIPIGQFLIHIILLLLSDCSL